jgi:uncharacterized protein
MMFLLSILLFILVFEFYFYSGFNALIKDLPENRKKIVRLAYWTFTILVVLYMASGMIIPYEKQPKFIRVYFTSFIIIVTVSKAFSSLVLLLDDIIRLFRWIVKKFITRKSRFSPQSSNKVSRLNFLTQMAMFVGAIPFFHMFYGMFKGAYNYTVRPNKLRIPGFPKAFNGLKIVHISDIHCGSFLNTEPLERAVEMINAQKADMVFITGDLVNNLADETDDFVETLRKIKAPMGIYSCLGNHDYGDYVPWKNPEDKKRNLDKMIRRQRNEFGWNLLMNENTVLEKNGQQLAIIGVENIGRSDRFPTYGNLQQAIKGTEDVPFKLLLSHDPYHFENEVSQMPEINFTFSGHTHGMQFGIDLPGFKWSPVQLVYKHWAGLLDTGKNYLYVNRGLGFIGYAGRAGIWPEITVHEFYS